MGSELGQRVNSPKSLTQLFDECCPVYMSIGMSYNEFWEGDVHLPKIYMEAYKLRIERERTQANFNAWLNGLYTMKAYSVVMANAFAAKNTEPQQYFSEPLPLTENAKAEQQKADEEAELLKTQIALSNWVNHFKSKDKEG